MCLSSSGGAGVVRRRGELLELLLSGMLVSHGGRRLDVLAVELGRVCRRGTGGWAWSWTRSLAEDAQVLNLDARVGRCCRGGELLLMAVKVVSSSPPRWSEAHLPRLWIRVRVGSEEGPTSLDQWVRKK